MNVCRGCGVQFAPLRNTFGIYCSNKCQSAYQKLNYIQSWLNGAITGYVGKTMQLAPPIRRHLKKERGSACSQCGWDEHHPIDGKSLTEIDHIDGNASNCRPENLRILCPNCHSMTPTFRNRNRNKSKRVRVLQPAPDFNKRKDYAYES